MASTLHIRGVAKAYGRITAADGIDLAADDRRVLGLIGPNGAGKTTLFSLVAGFLKPDAGEITACGVNVLTTALPPGMLGILPQDAAFARNIPIQDQLRFFMRLQGHSDADASAEVRRMLSKVGLSAAANRQAGTLSHGMAKRLALAQAFLGRPRLILLDEPTSGLDQIQARAIIDLIQEMRARTTLVISSHNLDQLETLCDDVAVLSRGRIIASGPMSRFVGGGRRIEMTLSAAPDEALQSAVRGEAGVEAFTMAANGSCSLTIVADADVDSVMSRVLGRVLASGRVPRALASAATLENEVVELLRSHEDAPTGGAKAATR